MLKTSYSNVNAIAEAISGKYPLYLPVKKGGECDFDRYESGKEIDLKTLKTVKSPKGVFFPQTENLMKFKTQGTLEIQDIRKEDEKFVLFGVRACDVKAFEVLDKVFLCEPVDTFYQSRRNNGIIVSLACGRPEETCFCKVFGVDASSPVGDVTTWIVGEEIFWQANTEKGDELTKDLASFFVKADGKTVEEEKKNIKNIIEKLPYSDLDISYFKNGDMNEIFKRGEWAKLSESCLGCGTCTFVCSTCQCYDVRDFKTDKGVTRFRCWDSCMYSDFTLMAGGNSRTTQMQRYRQRFMHKLVYYPQNNDGLFSCVGCGRCVKSCPQHLNIIKVIKTLGGKKGE